MHDSLTPTPNLILPPGTQIVTLVAVKGYRGAPLRPAGTVGVIVKSPADQTHSYRVCFPDGCEVSLHRHEFALRKEIQKDGLESANTKLTEDDLKPHIIYRCVIGSRAYGLEGPDSDTDRRGIYLPPASLQWSLFGVPEQIESEHTQECYWELRKFLILALKANPNVLECLYTPHVETVTPLAQELLDMRSGFLSRIVYQTYNGYVMSQFKKLEADIRNQGAVKWKHAMHLIRLLLSGVQALRDGFIAVRVVEHRDQLLAIRRGDVEWEAVNAWRLSLHREFDAAYAQTKLPERPDYQKANAFLIKARSSML